MNKEELDLLEIVFTLAIGECYHNDIDKIKKLEDKIKTINNLYKKQKEINRKSIEYIKREDICIDIRKTDGSLDYVSTDELLQILENKEVSE